MHGLLHVKLAFKFATM